MSCALTTFRTVCSFGGGEVRSAHTICRRPSLGRTTTPSRSRFAMRCDEIRYSPRATAISSCDSARQFPTDRESYQDGKSEFVLSALARTARPGQPAT